MKKIEQRVKPVEVGESIIDANSIRQTIGEACSAKNNGIWFCVTHREAFANQFAKDVHVTVGEHRLAWVCNEHGFEKP